MTVTLPEGLPNDRPATAKQLAALVELGCIDVAGRRLSMAAASELIGQLIAERKKQTDAMIEDAKHQAEQIDLVALAGQRVELAKVAANEYAGPCPRCGGTDRLHVTAQWFFCRHCHKERGDALGYLGWLNDTNFVTTCEQLTGGNMSTITAAKVQPTNKVTLPTPSVWDEPKQRREALEAHTRLLDGQTGLAKAALAYLQGRGIEQATVEAFKVGCTLVGLPNTWDKPKREYCYPKQNAITLPWFNLEGVLQLVKYRFVESHTYADLGGKEHAENKTSRGSASGHLFGWQAFQGPEKRQVLIVTEGEMNALSLWQVGHQWVDVLSTGSESTTKTLPAAVVDLAKQYKHVIVWADKGTIANEAALSIGAASMKSPTVKDSNCNPIMGADGKPKQKDANDLLQEGKLLPLLAAMFKRLGVTLPAPEAQPAPVEVKPALDLAPTEYDTLPMGDLTQWVGATVDDETWAELQTEADRRYGGGFVFSAKECAEGWRVTLFASAGWQP